LGLQNAKGDEELDTLDPLKKLEGEKTLNNVVLIHWGFFPPVH